MYLSIFAQNFKKAFNQANMKPENSNTDNPLKTRGKERRGKREEEG